MIRHRLELAAAIRRLQDADPALFAREVAKIPALMAGKAQFGGPDGNARFWRGFLRSLGEAAPADVQKAARAALARAKPNCYPRGGKPRRRRSSG